MKAVESYNTRKDSAQEKYEGLFDRLKSKKTILVGHNVFIDLIYFYSSFLGQLPNKVEDFEHRIHEIFPTIIDTKYLATQHSANPALPRSSLDELDEDLTTFIPAPVIGEFTNPPEQLVHNAKISQTPPLNMRGTWAALDPLTKLDSIAT